MLKNRSSGVEACSQEAEHPCDWVLDDVTGYDGSEVDYVLSEAARCSRCLGEIIIHKAFAQAQWLLSLRNRERENRDVIRLVAFTDRVLRIHRDFNQVVSRRDVP